MVLHFVSGKTGNRTFFFDIVFNFGFSSLAICTRQPFPDSRSLTNPLFALLVSVEIYLRCPLTSLV